MLSQDGKKLSAALHIDNHVLQGDGETDGTRFDVVLVHADGSGPGHSERLRLTGKREGGGITGSFDNGTDQGSWTGTREKNRRCGAEGPDRDVFVGVASTTRRADTGQIKEMRRFGQVGSFDEQSIYRVGVKSVAAGANPMDCWPTTEARFSD